MGVKGLMLKYFKNFLELYQVNWNRTQLKGLIFNFFIYSTAHIYIIWEDKFYLHICTLLDALY